MGLRCDNSLKEVLDEISRNPTKIPSHSCFQERDREQCQTGARNPHLSGARLRRRSRPTPRKLLDVSKLHTLGWCQQTGLHEEIARTYRSFQASPGSRF